MLEGTEVLWEEKLSYYDLMVMRLTEGEASFNSEEQNEPINPEDCIFNPEWFEFYNEAEIDFKNRDFLFFGFVDPSLGKTKHSDFSAIITLAKHKVSGYMYVMDADIERRHPDKIIGDILEKEKMLPQGLCRAIRSSELRQCSSSVPEGRIGKGICKSWVIPSNRGGTADQR